MDDADDSFEIIFSLVEKYVGNREAMGALAEYSKKSRLVAFNNVSLNMASISKCLEEARTTRDKLEAEDDAAEDVLAAQSNTINGYIRKRSYLKTRYQVLKDDRKCNALLTIRSGVEYGRLVAYATQHGFYPSHRFATSSAHNMPEQDGCRLDEDREDAGEVHHTLVACSSPNVKGADERERSDSFGNVDGTAVELLYPDYNIVTDVGAGLVRGRDGQSSSGNQQTDEPDHDLVTTNRSHARDDDSDASEQDELDSDSDDQDDAAQNVQTSGPKSRQRTSTSAGKQLKDNGAICVQWSGSVRHFSPSSLFIIPFAYTTVNIVRPVQTSQQAL